MTPEEQATEIVRRGYVSSDFGPDSWLEMPASEMIKAVAKAIAAEREACAKLAEDFVADVEDRDGTWSDIAAQACEQVGAAIRARR